MLQVLLRDTDSSNLQQRVEPMIEHLCVGTPSLIRGSGYAGTILLICQGVNGHCDSVVGLLMELGVYGLQIFGRV